MRRPTLRVQIARAGEEGVLRVEFVPGSRNGYVWIGEGTRALGFCGIKALKQFVASCERAQKQAQRPPREDR